MNDLLGFDPTKYLLDTPADEGFKPLPKGRYDCQISEAEKVVSKAGNDTLRLKFKVTGPKYEGRIMWEYFSIFTPGKGGEVGKQRLSSLLQVVNCLSLANFDQLVGKSAKCLVIAENDRNRIISFSPAGDDKRTKGDDDLPF